MSTYTIGQPTSQHSGMGDMPNPTAGYSTMGSCLERRSHSSRYVYCVLLAQELIDTEHCRHEAEAVEWLHHCASYDIEPRIEAGDASLHSVFELYQICLDDHADIDLDDADTIRRMGELISTYPIAEHFAAQQTHAA